MFPIPVGTKYHTYRGLKQHTFREIPGGPVVRTQHFALPWPKSGGTKVFQIVQCSQNNNNNNKRKHTHTHIHCLIVLEIRSPKSASRS